MSAPIIAFCNPRRGVGTTTLVYHLAYMFSDLGVPALMADLDPQADLSARVLGPDRLRSFLSVGGATVYHRRQGASVGISLGNSPTLLAGDPRVAQFERSPSSELPSNLHAIFSDEAESCGAAIVLVDLAPNLGALNRAALLATKFLVIPTAADPLARNAGHSLVEALGEWTVSKVDGARWLGYVSEFRDSGDDDIYDLGRIHSYRSLAEMSEEAGKPMFHLTEADGALGSHFAAMQSARKDFEAVARKIAERIGLKIPQSPGA